MTSDDTQNLGHPPRPKVNALAADAGQKHKSIKPLMGTANGTMTTQSREMRSLCLELERKVDRLQELKTDDDVIKEVQGQVRIARGVIDDALTRYRPDELVLAYNGGKDCLVLLVLILASLPSHFGIANLSSSSSHPKNSSNSNINGDNASAPSFPTSLQALYIRHSSPFPEVDDFVASTTQTYHLDLTTSNQSMKAALADYMVARGHVKAVFVGTRRTDPHGAKLSFFDETDNDWPRMMRVHPVIDWHYRDIWTFIRALEVPYCPLYDMGYTSLGGTDDTYPNPALKEEQNGFKPAYQLTEDCEERLGRDR